MSAASAGLFKARRFGSAAAEPSSAKQSFLADSTSDYVSFSNTIGAPSTGATELTKNDKYCVSRLPALPPLLSAEAAKNNPQNDTPLINGYTDNATKCALAIGESAINVWPYSSTDDAPITFEFPLGDTEDAGLQLAILTRPTPGTTLDPGLAIIHASTGRVCFYESVQYAPALGMINGKTIETTVNISAAQGEYITLAENVEPAGIAVATSWKRVVLVLLRDYKGAPKLSTLELTRPQTRLFSRWLGAADEITDEIVSIKAGHVTQGTTEIAVQDAAGTFKRFVVVMSGSGAIFLDHHRTVSYKLSAYLEKNIDGLIPGSVLDTTFLDLWPSVQDHGVSPDIYVSLVAVRSSSNGVEEGKLLLLKLKINESGVLVHGSHQLPEVDQIASAARPRLYIPKPGKTAFVAIGNAVVLTDLNPVSTRPASTTFQYYEPKWEDVVQFKSSVQIVGFGYEDKTDEAENPALVFITAQHGVVRIERFSENSAEIVAEDPSDPVSLLKSHIQQGIYYGESSLVDFNVGDEYSLDTISPAVTAVVSEILGSTSPYLPANFSSTRDSFALRIRLLKALIDYTRTNFPEDLYVVLPVIVEALEKLEVASNLWTILDSTRAESATLKTMLKTTIKHHDLAPKQTSHDTLRSFFTYNVDEILTVFTELVDVASASDVPLPILVELLVRTLHDGVHKTEVAYIFGNVEIPPVKLWLFDSNLLVKSEEIYTRAFCSSEHYQPLESPSSRADLISFTETLYFLISSAILFMQQTNDDQLHDYMQWYNNRKGAWIEALITRGMTKEALAIAQKYHDFYSVAHILDKEREQTSPEYVSDKIDFFMNQYGYDFASKLFDFYLSKDQMQRILVDSKQYTSFLEQYFAEHPKKSSKISWIYYLQDRDFQQASNVLISLSSEKSNEDQENKEFNYSLAKLTAIAAKAEGTGESYKLDEIAVEAESNLVVIRIQNKLHESLSSFVDGKKELMTLDYFIDNFSNPQLNRTKVAAEIEAFFDRFVDQKSLSKEQLISLLTVIKPTARFEHVFADALKLAALINNDAIFHEQASNIWKKLICTTDDWTQIAATEENSDEVIKTRSKETTMFKTLKDVQGNKEIMKVLDTVLSETSEDHMAGDGPWDAKLGSLTGECNVKMWIDTLRNEAK